jgi:hypothetical protein
MKSLTVERCLARAERLRHMADRADHYSDIMTYEALATEWLVLAGRLAATDRGPWSPESSEPKVPACTWRNIRSWFRIVETLGNAARRRSAAG